MTYRPLFFYASILLFTIVKGQEWSDLISKGSQASQNNDQQGAIQYFTQALDLLEIDSGKTSRAYAMTLYNVAYSEFLLERDIPAIEKMIEARNIMQPLKDQNPRSREFYGEVLRLSGVIYYYIKNYTECIANYESLLMHYDAYLDSYHTNRASTHFGLGNAYYKKYNYRKAIDNYLLGKDIYANYFAANNTPAGTRLEYINQLILNLSFSYRELKQYEQAAESLSQLCDLIRQAKGTMSIEYVNAYYNLALIYRMDEKFDLAISTLSNLEMIANQIIPEGNNFYSDLYLEYLNVYNDKGDERMANVYLLKSYRFFLSSRPDNESIVEISFHVGTSLTDASMWQEAFDVYARIDSLMNADTPLSKEQQLTLDLAKGKCHYYLNNLVEAENRLELAKDAAIQGQWEYLEAMAYLCYVSEKKKAPDLSNRYSELITFSLDQLRTDFVYLSETEKRYQLSQYRPIWDRYKRYVLSKANPSKEELESLLLLHTSTKGLILRSMTAVKDEILKVKDEQLLKQFESMAITKTTLSNLAMSVILPGHKPSLMMFNSSQKRADSLERELSRLVDLREIIPRKSSMTRIQKNLTTKEAVVEMIEYLHDDQVFYHGLVMTKEDAFTVALGTNGLITQADYKSYINRVLYNVDNESSFSVFWEPLHKRLKRLDLVKVYLAASGVYHLINIAGLQIDKERFVSDDMAITNIVSSNSILDFRTESPSLKRLVAFGNPAYDTTGYEYAEPYFTPLKGTDQEVKSIARMFASSDRFTQVFLGNRATKTALRSLESPDVLHIATHGYFIDQKLEVTDDNSLNFDKSSDPLAGKLYGSNMVIEHNDAMLRSGLVFAGAESYIRSNGADKMISKDTGILTAMEATLLDLQACELVVLSACQTGVGDLTDGEGVYGIKRAIQIAGADRMILSLWKVADEPTQEFMEFFYNNLIANQMDIESAFRSAQRKLREKYPSPYYWSAFVYIRNK